MTRDTHGDGMQVAVAMVLVAVVGFVTAFGVIALVEAVSR